MTTTKKIQKHHIEILGASLFAIVVILTGILPAITSAAGPTVRQGTTSTYGVLAATTITNTGATTMSGTAGADVGLSPGTSYTGSGSVTRSGVDHIADGAAAIAQSDLTTAYGDVAAPTPTTLANQDLAGQTIGAGVYATAAGTFSNSGTLTLNAAGDASAIFIFQAASTVITSNLSTMVLTNGAQACNVYWQVGSSATLGVSSTFVGHVYALTSIAANTGATVYGQLLARNGAVTLDNNTIVNNSCVTPAPAPVATQASIPSPPQDSEITSITSSACTTTSDYSAYVLGYFPTPISNIAVNTVMIPSSQWVQTLNQVEIRIPKSTLKTFTIDIFNGRIPLLATQVFICTTPEVIIAAVTPTPTPTETPTPAETETETAVEVETVTVTETGGELPTTGTDYYNYLLLGAALAALGAGGFIVRKRITR